MCVCIILSSSDLAIREWSSVQYPVYSLSETGSQRDGEITEMSSPAHRKQTQFVFTPHPSSCVATRLKSGRETAGVMRSRGFRYIIK